MATGGGLAEASPEDPGSALVASLGEGDVLGATLPVAAGAAVGFGVGLGVGFGVGRGVGRGVGLGVGLGVGFGVGLGVGFGVGGGVGAMTVRWRRRVDVAGIVGCARPAGPWNV